MRWDKLSRASALAFAATGVLQLGATAQDQAIEEAGGRIEEVVVTAQKREQSQQDVPISITTLRGERLDVLRSGGEDIRFLSNTVPSLQIESSFGRTFPRFYIRGLGNADFDLNASQPVALIYDDVVLENPILKGFPVFDLDRVEVLRGPQGTLFGRNTPAGIVKFESAKPSHELDGYARVGYGRFNQFEVESALGGSLIQDVLAARISVLYQRRDDYVDNFSLGFDEAGNTIVDGVEEDAFEGFDEFAGRLQFLFTPTDNFSALFNVHGRFLDGTARVFRANIIEPGTDNIVQTVPGSGTLVGGPFNFGFEGLEFTDFDRQTVFQDGQNFQTVSNIGGFVNLEYVSESLGLTFKSVTAVESAGIDTVGDIDGGSGSFITLSLETIGVLPPGTAPPIGPGNIPFDAQTSDVLDSHRQITEEFIISSNEWGLFDFQVGFYFFDEELTIDTINFDTIFGNVVNGFSTQTQDTRSLSVFANVNLELTPSLTVEGGVRYSDDKRDFVAERPIPLPFGVAQEIIPPSFAFTRADPIAWDVSATYAVNEDVNVFARIARSFRAPSIQGRVLFAGFDGVDPATNGISVADTEFIISYEGGFKADLFDRRARFNLTGFFYDLDDQQVTAVGGTTNIAQLVNVADSRGFGFEAELEAAPTDNLFFTAGISYNDTEFQDPDLAVGACGSPCTITDPFFQVPNPAPPTADLDGLDEFAFIDGNPFPQAPEWVIAWTARYGIPFRNGEFFAFTDWNYRSRVNFFLYESLEFTDGGLVEGGVRLGYVGNEGQYEIAIFGRNILNDVSRTGGVDFNNLAGFVNEPPVWGITFQYRL